MPEDGARAIVAEFMLAVDTHELLGVGSDGDGIRRCLDVGGVDDKLAAELLGICRPLGGGGVSDRRIAVEPSGARAEGGNLLVGGETLGVVGTLAGVIGILKSGDAARVADCLDVAPVNLRHIAEVAKDQVGG